MRGPANQEEYQKYAKLPLIPWSLATPEDDGPPGLDAHPREELEARFPEPSIQPADPAAGRFVSALLEEFGDEWGNKWMFHYRWWREADQDAASREAHRREHDGTSRRGATSSSKGVAGA